MKGNIEQGAIRGTVQSESHVNGGAVSKSNGTYDYEKLQNKPSINGVELSGDKSTEDLLIKSSEIDNDAGFIDKDVDDLTNYYDKTNIDAVFEQVGEDIQSVADAIPTKLSDLEDDATHRTVTDEDITAWNSKSDFSGDYDDLSNKPDIPSELADLTEDTTHRVVTDTEKQTWNGKSKVVANPENATDTLTSIDIDGTKYVIPQGGGGGDVQSVNGKTGVVVLDASDVRALPDDTPIPDAQIQSDWEQSDNTKKDFIKNKPTIPAAQVNSDWDAASGVAQILNKPTLGTAAALDVATSGDASSSQVVKGDDSRLSDSRNAADVYSWAKAETKPSYTASEVGAIASTSKGSANGVAELDSTGKVPSSQLPSFVDDVLEYASLSAFPATGETGKIYIALDTNKTYRWSGSAYVEISESLALGETASTAYAGNKGKANADAIAAMKDGSTIDSFGDVETALGDKVSKSNTSGLLKNDGSVDTTSYAKQSEMSVTNGTGSDADKVTIQLKDGTSTTVLKTHQDISNKVDKEQGKGLSTNDYTTAEKEKLAGIATGAEVNVQADWNQTDSSADDYIKNKPSEFNDTRGSQTATGEVITVTDAADIYAEEVQAAVAAMQDLHGYTKPWVAGGGRNKLPLTVEGIKAADGGAGSWTGNTKVKNDVTFTILTNNAGSVIGIKANGTASADTRLIMVMNMTVSTNTILNGCPSGGSASNGYCLAFVLYSGGQIAFADTGSGVSITNSTQVNCDIVITRGTTVSNKIFYPMLRLSSDSDTSFVPYENVCPIQGYDIVSVDRTGKNVWGGTAMLDEFYSKVPSATKTDNTVSFTAANVGGKIFAKLPYKANTAYTFILVASLSVSNINSNLRIYYTDGTSVLWRNSDSSVNTKKTIVVVTDASKTVDYVMGENQAGTLTVYFNESGVFEGNIATSAFEPYNGQTVSIQLGNKNLLPMTVEGIKAANTTGTWSGNVYSINNGTITLLTDENGLVVGIKANGTFNANTTFYVAHNFSLSGNYTLTGCPSGGSAGTYYIGMSVDGSWSNRDTGSGITVNGTIVSTAIALLSGQVFSNLMFYPMLRSATVTDPTFSPYNPTLGGMVYGGQLTLNDDGSAVFVGTHGEVDLGEVTYGNYPSLATSGTFVFSVSNRDTSQPAMLCSAYNPRVVSSWSDLNNGEVIARSGETDLRLKNTSCTTNEQIIAANMGQQFVYKLATPFTIHLSAEQLKLLQGTNNVWSNAGNVSLKYQPDNVIAEPKADVQRLRDDVDDRLVGNACRNLFNKNGTQTTTYGTATIDGEKITCTGTYYCQIDMPLKADVFTVSAKVKSYGATHGFRFMYEDGSTSSMADSMTVDTNGKNVKSLLLYCGTGTSATTVYEYVQVERGSSPTAYEEYYPSNRELWEMVKALQ